MPKAQQQKAEMEEIMQKVEDNSNKKIETMTMEEIEEELHVESEMLKLISELQLELEESKLKLEEELKFILEEEEKIKLELENKKNNNVANDNKAKEYDPKRCASCDKKLKISTTHTCRCERNFC